MAPRNVRNFWLELTVDGRKSRIACGPVRKDGGFDLVIKQRHKGKVMEVGDIIGRAYGNRLDLRGWIKVDDGKTTVETYMQTERD